MPFDVSPVENRLWLPFTCSVAVDAGGVMVANGTTTVQNQVVLQTAQPTDISDCEKVLYINGSSDVTANGYGRCTMAEAPVVAIYSGTAPSAGDMCGPQATSWSLLKDNPGFLAISAGASNRVVVVRHLLECWQAEWIEFYLAAALATTDDSVACDNVTYHNGYTPSTAITTVYNKSASSNYIFEGDDNDRGIALCLSNNAYRICQMECP